MAKEKKQDTSIEVKDVGEINPETVTPEKKEAAVLQKAVDEGKVAPEYGLQDDGVYKVNLDKPADGLKVFLTAYRDTSSDFRVLYSLVRLCIVCKTLGLISVSIAAKVGLNSSSSELLFLSLIHISEPTRLLSI